MSTPTDLHSHLGAGLRAAIELAERSDRRGLRVADLADAAGLTTDQLERAMRRVLGVSPKQHLMAIRLQRAAALLAIGSRELKSMVMPLGAWKMWR